MSDEAGASVASAPSQPTPQMPPATAAPVSSAFKEIMDIVSDDTPSTDGTNGTAAAVSDEAPRAAADLPQTGFVKARHGEAEIEVPEDATFTFKVDGQEVTATYKDLQRNYQGKVPWERRYKETKDLERNLHSEKTKILAEFNEHRQRQVDEQKFIKESLEIAARDPLEFITRMALKQGKNPVDFVPAYIKQAQATVEHISRMSDAELNNMLGMKKVEYDKELLETKVKAQETQTKQKETLANVQKHIDGLITKYQVTQEEFETSQRTLETAIQNGFKVDNLNGEQIADLLVSHVVQFQRPESKLVDIVGTVSTKLAHDKNFLAELKHHISDRNGNLLQDITEDDIAQIVRGFLGDADTPATSSTKSQEVFEAPSRDSRERSTRATSQKIPPNKAAARAKSSEGDDDDPLSMDDILKSYRR
jgi:hypothetical protein